MDDLVERLREKYRPTIYFERRDCWVGLFWDTRFEADSADGIVVEVTVYYLCLVPCLPIRWGRVKMVEAQWYGDE